MRGLFAEGATPRLAAMGILAVAAGWLATSSLQQDFSAYYTAGAAMGRGLDPYRNYLATPGGPWDGVAVFQHSRFLYPPLVAALFRPIAALPFLLAKALYTAASVAALFVGLTLVDRERPVARRGTRDYSILHLVAPIPWALWPPVLLTLERGQIDLLLFAVMAVAWRWRHRVAVAGPLLAVAVVGKPLALGVYPLLFAARRYRLAAAALGTLMVLGGLNVLIAGRALSAEYLRDVLPRAALYGEGGPATTLLDEKDLAGVSADLADGIARIDGHGRAFLQGVGSFRRNASLPRLLAGDDDAPSRPAGIAVYFVLGIALAFAARRHPDRAAWYWGGLVAAVVAAPVSWAMGLVWALPLLGDWSGIPHRKVAVRWLLGAAFAAGVLGPLWAPAWVLAGLLAVAAAVLLTLRSNTGP
jgi:hypothetical protein